MDTIWTSKEVSEYLRINEETVRRLTRRGEIPCYKVGNLWRYKAEEIKSLEWAK